MWTPRLRICLHMGEALGVLFWYACLCVNCGALALNVDALALNVDPLRSVCYMWTRLRRIKSRCALTCLWISEARGVLFWYGCLCANCGAPALTFTSKPLRSHLPLDRRGSRPALPRRPAPRHVLCQVGGRSTDFLVALGAAVQRGLGQ
eukprot:scaffold2659_cov107-Isochrysis_galbana.AAC.1